MQQIADHESYHAHAAADPSLNRTLRRYITERYSKAGGERFSYIGETADGNIFELVEHSRYNGSEPERGKNTKVHGGVNYWDYFIKTVQVDEGVFDLTANVRKKSNGRYVYAIEMHENKK